MKQKKVKISLYWKCQLWGWFSLAVISFIGISYGPDFNIQLLGNIRYVIQIMISGILFSHFMRLYIKKWKLADKSFWKLILPISILTIFFGTLVGIFARFREVELVMYLWKANSMSENAYLIFETVMNGAFLLMLWNIIYFFYQNQQRNKRQEQDKATLKLQTIELEAKALRAQMNPHFVFNCLNSIKSLIQQNETEKSVTYLTTFSKLIRTLLNNADKKLISLYDEIETCKLYLQLEAMRFDTKFSYAFDIDDTIDLKSIQIPALIIQPFIENAIWHGIVPRNTGGQVSLNVLRKDGVVEVVIDDDGIGREASKQNRAASGLTHQSKGVNLTQSRLELNNLLQQRQAELETIDKKDENDKATGTTVIIRIKEELS